MCDDLTRRNAMTVGAALALAAPFSTLSTASASDAEDWPEFKPWLADAVALDAYYAETTRLWSTLSNEERHDREHSQTEEMDRISDLARAIAEKPAHTERHIAMLVTLAVWAAEKGGGDNFNVAAIVKPDDDIAEATSARLLMALAARAAVILPEVPFTFPTEV